MRPVMANAGALAALASRGGGGFSERSRRRSAPMARLMVSLVLSLAVIAVGGGVAKAATRLPWEHNMSRARTHGHAVIAHAVSDRNFAAAEAFAPKSRVLWSTMNGKGQATLYATSGDVVRVRTYRDATGKVVQWSDYTGTDHGLNIKVRSFTGILARRVSYNMAVGYRNIGSLPINLLLRYAATSKDLQSLAGLEKPFGDYLDEAQRAPEASQIVFPGEDQARRVMLYQGAILGTELALEGASFVVYARYAGALFRPGFNLASGMNVVTTAVAVYALGVGAYNSGMQLYSAGKAADMRLMIQVGQMAPGVDFRRDTISKAALEKYDGAKRIQDEYMRRNGGAGTPMRFKEKLYEYEVDEASYEFRNKNLEYLLDPFNWLNGDASKLPGHPGGA